MRLWRWLVSWWPYNIVESGVIGGIICVLLTILIPSLVQARARAHPGHLPDGFDAVLGVVVLVTFVPAVIFGVAVFLVALYLTYWGIRECLRKTRSSK